MYGGSVVWGDGAIEWNDLPAWVRSLNCAEARRVGTAPTTNAHGRRARRLDRWYS